MSATEDKHVSFTCGKCLAVLKGQPGTVVKCRCGNSVGMTQLPPEQTIQIHSMVAQTTDQLLQIIFAKIVADDPIQKGEGLKELCRAQIASGIIRMAEGFGMSFEQAFQVAHYIVSEAVPHRISQVMNEGN